jgi:uncharacterized surface protein with fasciclin (FAS1) repeats
MASTFGDNLASSLLPANRQPPPPLRGELGVTKLVKQHFALMALAAFIVVGSPSCSKAETPQEESTEINHRSNIPPMAPDNIVSLALESEDHTTLVAAIQAAEYVTSVAASGPLTVFAPTNAAFDALPDGTVEGLLKPEAADDLREILKYHVTTSGLQTSSFSDGQIISMANGKKVTMGVDGDKYTINGANIVASVKASNGVLHIIDAVLLPPSD